MKKLFSLFLASVLILVSMPSASFANSNIDAYDEVERQVYTSLSEAEILLLKSFEHDEKVQLAVFENYRYDSNGNMSLEVSNIEKFSKDTGLDIDTSNEYINSVNRVLDIVNGKLQSVQDDQNQVAPRSNTKCDYTKEILKSFTYESNYCKRNTEKILDNISRNSGILSGISLAGFWNPYVSIATGLGSIFANAKHSNINKQFRNSGYKGVINRVVKVPMSTDGSYWRPLGTKWDGSNPNP